MTELATLLAPHRLIPVITITDEAHAVPLAEALLEGGIGVMEITLRHKAGLGAIAKVRKELPEVCVGSGTVLNASLLQQSVDAGAQFAVSPGLTPALAEAAQATPSCPLLPGVATISEAMRAGELGFSMLKLFPATIVGGADLLKNIGSVLPQLRFCPTGGIGETTANDFLALKNVFAVGGSWLTPATAMEAGDWKQISAIAKRSLAALA